MIGWRGKDSEGGGEVSTWTGGKLVRCGDAAGMLRGREGKRR